MNLKVFTGNAHRELASTICKKLTLNIGDASVSRFSDGEVQVEINENVRGCDVFVVQPTCAPTNDHLMELVVMIDALKRASAGRITAVVPYFGYARQDRRPRSARVPITAKVKANIIQAAGTNRLLTVDLHADQIQGFFDIPVDNIFATPLIVEDIRQREFNNPIIVSPDVGGVLRARALAKTLGDLDIAIIDKRRDRANHSDVMNIIGDVENCDCIMVDDIVDTGGTMCKAASALRNNGATGVFAYCTHGVLSGPALNYFEESEMTELVVTNTIPVPDHRIIRAINIDGLLARAIRQIHTEESVSSLFG